MGHQAAVEDGLDHRPARDRRDHRGPAGSTFRQIPFLIVGFGLGVVAQGVKICVDTIVQQYVDDAYLGRVFSLYDMLFNVALVLGAAVSAPFMPVNGKSYALVTAVALGYLAAGAAFAALNRGQATAAPEPSEPARPAAPATDCRTDPQPEALVRGGGLGRRAAV